MIRKITAFAILGLTFGFAIAQAQLPWTGDEHSTVYVDVNSTWTGSGVYVNEGDAIVMRAEGHFSVWGEDGNHWWHWMGPKGWLIEGGGGMGSPLPDWPGGCLTARIGDGDRFYVGDFNCIIAMTSGELFFGLNETTFFDNRGTLNVYLWLPCTSTNITDDRPAETLGGLQLRSNYPNPFNPTTTMEFSLANAAHVELGIYDVSGRLVKVLADQYVEAGVHRSTWHGENLMGESVSSGCYFVRIRSNGESQSRAITLLR